MLGFHLIACSGTRTVNDDFGPRHRSLYPLTSGQITGHERDAVPGILGMPAEHPYHATSILQPRDNETPECACTASNQCDFLHCSTPSRMRVQALPRRRPPEEKQSQIRG